MVAREQGVSYNICHSLHGSRGNKSWCVGSFLLHSMLQSVELMISGRAKPNCQKDAKDRISLNWTNSSCSWSKFLSCNRKYIFSLVFQGPSMLASHFVRKVFDQITVSKGARAAGARTFATTVIRCEPRLLVLVADFCQYFVSLIQDLCSHFK